MNTAAESANEFWVEFNSQVEKLRAAISHPPAEDTQDYVLRVKTTITELQNCKDPTSRCKRPLLVYSLATFAISILCGLPSHRSDATISTITLPAYDIKRSQDVSNMTYQI
jgi:hypothetical protein